MHPSLMVSTHSRLKAAGKRTDCLRLCRAVSTHSRLKAAGAGQRQALQSKIVSTHSRLKAAGKTIWAYTSSGSSFNTQPPEGGWVVIVRVNDSKNTVSTHSRLKAAGVGGFDDGDWFTVSTHSRLKAAGSVTSGRLLSKKMFQHTAA